MYSEQATVEAVVAAVEKVITDNGLKETHEIVWPGPNQLQLDIDSETLPERFIDRLQILLKVMDGPVSYTTYVSRHGRRHVVVDLPRVVTPLERIAWQAALGSDPMRETLGLWRLAQGNEKATLLIHRKDGSDVLAKDTVEPVGRKFR